jgi:hypothetical protein
MHCWIRKNLVAAGRRLLGWVETVEALLDYLPNPLQLTEEFERAATQGLAIPLLEVVAAAQFGLMWERYLA